MFLDEATAFGAQQIIQRCLGLSKGQDLLVIIDETTIDVALVFAEASHHLLVPQTTILVPVVQQTRIPRATSLSTITSGAARDARAILTCVNPTPECLPFRDSILET